jgi:chromosomal replication initiator protein
VTDGVYSISFDPSAERPRAATTWPLGEFFGDAVNPLVPVAAEDLLSSAPRYNPVVFCGPTGVGKSHLLHGLTQCWRQVHPRAEVLFFTGADFARNYANAVQADGVAEARAKMAQAALLVVDGLEELVKKPAAQQELIHTLDAALVEGAQVLIASREPLPSHGAFLPALASRLSAGLLVPLAPPGPAARRELVERLAEALAPEMEDDARDLLAAELSATAAELHHAVVELNEAARREKRPIVVAAVRRFLDDRNDRRRPTCGAIATQVAKRFRLKATDLQGKTRRREVVQARGVAMLLARQLTGASYEAVGRHFGGRDHSTVMHACRRTAEQVKTDPLLKQAIEELAEPWVN